MKKLTEEDYIQVSEETGLELALIKTVAAVEGSGSGFDKDGVIKILFEGHVFYKHLSRLGIAQKTAAQFPKVCYPKWTKQFYTGSNRGEWLRMNIAQTVNEEAALKSASFGLFQVLGENFEAAGYSNVFQMVEAYNTGEKEHLKSFINFIEHENIVGYLVAKDWANFALRYNGKGYKANKYDIKLAEAYAKFKK